MSNDLNGADFRALQRLSNGHDETLAEIGETCARVPATSLPWLLRDGLIEPAGDRAIRETPDRAPADEEPF